MEVWHTEEDFEKDWWSLAEDPALSRPLPPVTNTLKAARSQKPSIYEAHLQPDEECENIEYTTNPSRGRSFSKLKLKKPGRTEEVIHTKLREVCGIGYSNEVIEQLYANSEDCCDRKANNGGKDDLYDLSSSDKSSSSKSSILSEKKN